MGSIHENISIGSGDDFVPNMQHAIALTSYKAIHRHVCITRPP